MENIEERSEVIRRQEAKSKEVEEASENLKLEERKFKESFSSFGDKKVTETLKIPLFETRAGLFRYLISLQQENGERWKMLSNDYASLMVEKKSFDFSCFDKARYTYYEKLLEYLLMIEKDRQDCFPKQYQEEANRLAEDGWFLFYQETPDMDSLFSGDCKKDEAAIVDFLSQDDYGPLIGFFSVVLFEERERNQLEIAKEKDITAALICLQNGCYDACARILFALLENDHANASSIFADCFKPGKAFGNERAQAIEKQILAQDSFPSFRKFWEQFNSFYKAVNSDSGFDGLSRNDLAHGAYRRDTTPADCIRLFLAFASFKTLSFALQEIDDIRRAVTEDLEVFLTTK